MPDLTVNYMGLELKNPLIAASSGLTGSINSIKKLEENGIAAVVLKSLFEEQILMESKSMKGDFSLHAEETDYIKGYIRQNNLSDYLRMLETCKKETSIPIIASINCISASEWTDFAKQIEGSGADAIELNMFILPGDIEQTGEQIEKIYFDIIKTVSQKVSIPIAVKIGFYFTGLAKFVFDLSIRETSAIVLFNRYYRPDIDINNMEIIAADVFSSPYENAIPLRWISILSDKVKCDLSATTGIHDGYTTIKNLLAGAKTVQVATSLYKNGPQYIQTMLEQITGWLSDHGFKSVQDIFGKMSQSHIKNPAVYERSQFMKYYSDRK
ncbi:dihydroorotate dehydrogenase-like protein [bacterium]|nr:dihydroorotate dehydrogenase-like protein [bacterium]